MLAKELKVTVEEVTEEYEEFSCSLLHSIVPESTRTLIESFLPFTTAALLTQGVKKSLKKKVVM